MSGTTVTLRQADDSTISYVEALLEKNDVPSTDVQSKPGCFHLGYDGDDPVGIGGIEIYGTAGLLRSLVIEREVRGSGFGTAMCEALETEARDEDVETLYLLTTTASEFFADGRLFSHWSTSPGPASRLSSARESIGKARCGPAPSPGQSGHTAIHPVRAGEYRRITARRASRNRTPSNGRRSAG